MANPPAESEPRPRPRIQAKDVVQAAIFIGLAIMVFIGSLELASVKGFVAPSSAALPLASSVVLFVLAVLLVVFPTETLKRPSWAELLRVLGALALFIAYVLILPVLSFIISTWIFLIVILLVSGERKLLTVGLLPPITALLSFVLFYSFLGVSLPTSGIELFIHNVLF